MNEGEIFTKFKSLEKNWEDQYFSKLTDEHTLIHNQGKLCKKNIMMILFLYTDMI